MGYILSQLPNIVSKVYYRGQSLHLRVKGDWINENLGWTVKIGIVPEERQEGWKF